jgi:electron transfer flavoprotein beta subunit
MSAPMKILVCIKQVADPEGPSSAFDIDKEQKKIVVKGIPPVINPFDENALEAALKFKDTFGAHIIVISMVDDRLSLLVLKKAPCSGADELFFSR